MQKQCKITSVITQDKCWQPAVFEKQQYKTDQAKH